MYIHELIHIHGELIHDLCLEGIIQSRRQVINQEHGKSKKNTNII